MIPVTSGTKIRLSLCFLKILATSGFLWTSNSKFPLFSSLEIPLTSGLEILLISGLEIPLASCLEIPLTSGLEICLSSKASSTRAKSGTSYKPARSSQLDNISSTKNIRRKQFHSLSNTSGGRQVSRSIQTKQQKVFVFKFIVIPLEKRFKLFYSEINHRVGFL